MYANLTEEEKKRIMAQMMRQQSAAVPDPGMVTQTAGAPNLVASQSVEGEQGAIDNQMAYANMLRGRSAPQGRSVGPSGIYMGPNIGETLAHAGEQALGGYLSGKAQKKQKGLDKTRTATAAAKAEKEEQRYQEEKARADARIQLDRDRLERQQEQAAATLAKNEAIEAEKLVKLENKKDVGRLEANQAEIEETTERRRDMADQFEQDFKDTEKRDQKIADQIAREERAAARKPQSSAEGIAQYRSDSFDDGMDNMNSLLGEWNEETGSYAGYDPTTVGGFLDKQTNKFDMTRFLASKEGQQWAAHSETMKEAALRTATGAAAPETENSAYIMTLIPSPGDDQATVREKMLKLDRFSGYLDKLGGTESNEMAERAYEAAASKLRGEEGKPKESAPPPPEAGTVEGGYRFIGGDPADPNNWEQV